MQSIPIDHIVCVRCWPYKPSVVFNLISTDQFLCNTRPRPRPTKCPTALQSAPCPAIRTTSRMAPRTRIGTMSRPFRRFQSTSNATISFRKQKKPGVRIEPAANSVRRSRRPHSSGDQRLVLFAHTEICFAPEVSDRTQTHTYTHIQKQGLIHNMNNTPTHHLFLYRQQYILYTPRAIVNRLCLQTEFACTIAASDHSICILNLP